MKGIASSQFGQPADWISDRKRGDGDPSMVNEHDHYVNEWTAALSTTPKNEADKLASAAEVFLGYKEKSAGVVGALRTAKNVGKQFVERSAPNAALVGGLGGAAVGAAAGGEGNRLSGALAGGALGAGAGLGARKLIQRGNATQAAAAQKALVKPRAQVAAEIRSGIPRAPNQAQIMRSKTRDMQRQMLEERMWQKKRMNAPAAVAQRAAKTQSEAAALDAAKAGIKVPAEALAPEHAMRYATKSAGIMNRMGKGLAAKFTRAAPAAAVAPAKAPAMRVGGTAMAGMKRPALIGGGIGAASGALKTPEEGQSRLGNVLRRGAIGAGIGAGVGAAGGAGLAKLHNTVRHKPRHAELWQQMRKANPGMKLSPSLFKVAGLKSAADALANPSKAGDSVNAAVGSESSVKEAGAGASLLQALKTPSVGSALTWGLVGGATSAAGAPEGKRLSSALKAGLVGGALGAYVPHMERGGQRLADKITAWGKRRQAMAKVASPYDNTDTFDPVRRAAEKFPAEKVTAADAIKEDVSGAWELLREKARKLKQKKVELGTGIHPPEPSLDTTGPVLPKVAGLGKSVANAILPTKGKGVATGLMAGVPLAALTYWASRPRKDLDGKSKGEIAWKDVADRGASGDEGKMGPLAVKRRLEEKSAPMGASVAEFARKHPVATALFTGLLGYRAAHKLGPLLGK